MTATEKLMAIKSMLNISGTDEDEKLSVYLSLAQSEILSALYAVRGEIPENVTEVPTVYEPTQIMAVVMGFSQEGAEGETSHGENGINRNFKYSTMLDYIRNSVTPYVKVV